MEMSVSNNSAIFRLSEQLTSINEKDSVDLCISIFYNKSMWDALIINAIAPFIYKYKELPSFFYLSEYRGHHINLVVKIKKSEALDMAKSIETYFKRFIAVQPSNLILEEKEYLNYFKDFENNSIHYGLFDDYSDSLLLRFSIGLSDLLIFTFQEYKTEFHSSLNEIVFQIITIFCNATGLSDNEILKIFEKFLEKEYQEYETNALKEIIDLNEENFLDNKDILLDYLKEYRTKGNTLYEEKWEVEWHQFVHSFFNEVSENKEVKMAIVINRIMKMFEVKNRISIYYLLIRSVKEYKT